MRVPNIPNAKRPNLSLPVSNAPKTEAIYLSGPPGREKYFSVAVTSRHANSQHGAGPYQNIALNAQCYSLSTKKPKLDIILSVSTRSAGTRKRLDRNLKRVNQNADPDEINPVRALTTPVRGVRYTSETTGGHSSMLNKIYPSLYLCAYRRSFRTMNAL